MEFSKGLVIWLILFCILGIAASYVLAFFGLNVNDTVTVALITTILGSCVSYMIYQFKLKDSRNKYHVDVNGIPFNQKEKLEKMNKVIDKFQEEFLKS